MAAPNHLPLPHISLPATKSLPLSKKTLHIL
jgi:hypothetical protein